MQVCSPVTGMFRAEVNVRMSLLSHLTPFFESHGLSLNLALTALIRLVASGSLAPAFVRPYCWDFMALGIRTQVLLLR